MSKLTAYCLKTKQKNVHFAGTPIINKIKNRFICMGNDGKGHNMSCTMSEQKAIEAINSGEAKKGSGW